MNMSGSSCVAATDPTCGMRAATANAPASVLPVHVAALGHQAIATWVPVIVSFQVAAPSFEAQPSVGLYPSLGKRPFSCWAENLEWNETEPAAKMRCVAGSWGGEDRYRVAEPGVVSASMLRRRRRQRAGARLQGAAKLQPGSASSAPTKHANPVEPEETNAADVARTRCLADGLLDQLKRGDESSRIGAAVHFRNLAFVDKASSRAAQLALEGASAKDAVLLAGSLRGCVVKAMQSMHANYVLQRIISLTPASCYGFIAEELVQYGPEAARHRFGCRIVCRVIEFGFVSQPSSAMLIEEVMATLPVLCRHGFGSYVAMHLLEYGLPAHRHAVVGTLLQDIWMYAECRNGSRVVEAALRHCSVSDEQVLVERFLGAPANLQALAKGKFGCHVVKSLLRLSNEHKTKILVHLEAVRAELEASQYGGLVMAVADGTYVSEPENA